MQLKETEIIYEQFLKSKIQPLVKLLIDAAIHYSRLRVKWLLSDIQTRIEMDEERTRAHNSFISLCDALARNMNENGEDASWRKEVGENRKDIGDFAVLLVAVMGIRAR